MLLTGGQRRSSFRFELIEDRFKLLESCLAWESSTLLLQDD